MVPWTIAALPTIPIMTGIVGFFVLFRDFFAPVFNILIKLFELVPLFLDPVALANEVIIGITLGFTFLFNTIIDYLTPSRYFGTKGNNSGAVGGNTDTTRTTCYKTKLINILFLVLCPPLAIFMDGGYARFLEVCLCTVFTIYGYYFPGLIYAIFATRRKTVLKCK